MIGPPFPTAGNLGLTTPRRGTVAWLEAQDVEVILEADGVLFDKGLHRARRFAWYGQPRPLTARQAISMAVDEGQVRTLCRAVEDVLEDPGRDCQDGA